jgi:hypothetical protein
LAPQQSVGSDRTKIEARLGAPIGVGTDFVAQHGRIVTLDWQDVRIRLYEAPSTHAMSLVGVSATKDLLGIESPVHIGVDRGTVLRELGGPVFEDETQIVYSLQQESPDLPNDTLRFVFRDDRVVGIDWTFPL